MFAQRLIYVLSLLLVLPTASAEPRVVRVAYLTFSAGESQLFTQQLKDALSERGWVEGKNLEIIGRFPTGNPPDYASSARDLVALKPDLIYAAGAPAIRALFAATRDLPILATDFSSDPVASGYVLKYNRPGKNVAGVFLDAPLIAGKWFDILGGMVPNLKRVAVLWNPETGEVHKRAAQTVAKSLGINLKVYEVRSMDDVERIFPGLKGRHQGLIILPSPLAYAQPARLAELALKYRLPATSMAKRFAESGGLASYGPDLFELNKRAFSLAGRILEGAKPSELPIETPTKFDFLINTQTAKKLGLRLPDRFLVGAELVGR